MGRPRGRAKGTTVEANALAEWLQRLTAGLTLEQLSEQLPYGKSKWGRYLNGQDLVPDWLLEKAVAQRVREPKLRSLRLAEGRALLQAAEEAAHKPVPEKRPEATLAELSLRLDEARKGQLEAQATLFNANHLVGVLLATVATLQKRCAVLEDERDQAHQLAKAAYQDHLHQSASRLATAERMLEEARRERADAEEIRLAAQRVSERYERALSKLEAHQSVAAPKPAPAHEGVPAVPPLYEVDYDLEAMEDQLEAQGQKLASLRQQLQLPDQPTQVAPRIVHGEVVDNADNSPTSTNEVQATSERRQLAPGNEPTDKGSRALGSKATLQNMTELRALTGKVDLARNRLKLLYDAGVSIGTTLDVVRTAQELAEYAVARFTDYVSVDLADSVLRGDEPQEGAGSGDDRRTALRRTALSGIRDDAPLYPLGKLIPYSSDTPQARAFNTGTVTVVPVLGDFGGWQDHDFEQAQRILDSGVHSVITVPLRARGVVLGVANFMRAEKPEPFEEDDVSLAEELVTRAAVSIDNARRYTRERAMAVSLQRSMLPRVLPEQSALDVAYRYLPAESDVGGDWFDVIPLPGARVALVVGDVVGHGLHAPATMGRLRTSVHNFSTLDLPPDEILSHLDDLIARIDQDGAGGGVEVITGATCLYAIYDPVARRCTMARAGHPPPAVVSPDGTVEFPDLPVGPPLGLGGLPFETAELELPEGSHLVLYTDGLIERRDRDIETGLEMLRDALSHPDRTPEEACTAVLDALLPERPSDDIALIVARTRALEPDRIADWTVPADPAQVAKIRAAVVQRLTGWRLGDLAYRTELILSELITNAIRYATGPIRVRLLCDRSLICEVYDTSSTSPHLRYAAATDEGGRGLFLVSQFADRWGTRYTSDGKVIWTEQGLRGERGMPL